MIESETALLKKYMELVFAHEGVTFCEGGPEFMPWAERLTQNEKACLCRISDEVHIEHDKPESTEEA